MNKKLTLRPQVIIAAVCMVLLYPAWLIGDWIGQNVGDNISAVLAK